MKPRALAAVVLTFGGAFTLLASRSPRVMTTSRGLECQNFWAYEADPDANNEGVGGETGARLLRLVRNKNHATLDLGQGAFVGGLEDTHPSQPSSTYPYLKGKEKGCIWFKRYTSTTGVVEYDAYFYHQNGSKPIQLMNVLYCQHMKNGNPGRKPIWVPIPDNGLCEEFKLSVGTVTVTVKASAGKAFTTQSLFPQLKTELIKAGFSAAAADAVIKRAGGSGPWYPCEATGCCRAT